MKRLLLTALFTVSVAWPRSEVNSHVIDPVKAILKHQAQQARRPAAATLREGQPVETLLPDAGNIAVVDDSEGISIPAGFDLDQKTLEFKPVGANASQYTFSVVAGRFDTAAIASATAVQLGDDAAKEVPLPFAFPFYGIRYSSAFVGSDGHITFGVAEDSSFERDFVRMVVGPPRLAPLFTDLDPSQPNAVVSYVASASRFLVTWSNVPVYDDHPGPTIPRQTFQAALYPDGRIEFSYNGVNVAALTGALTVGIAPGGATRVSQISFVDLSGGSASTFATAIVEEFSNTPQFNVFALPNKFYKGHDDAYDLLIVFDTVNRNDPNCPCACASPLRNSARGIGMVFRDFLNNISEELDAGSTFGSPARLQALVYMGRLSRYPSDPNQATALADSCGRNSVMSILGQEAGHRFLAHALFVDPATGKPSTDLLGRDFAHWSFFLNTDASVMEGNQIVDRGEGASPRFETRDIVQRYSALDQYLMGLRAPEEVPTTFLVRKSSIDFPAGHPPQSGLLFDGTRLDITVPMIVAAEGPRAPNSALAQKTFHFAFVLLVPAGATASAADVAKLDAIRTAWETYFAGATDNRGKADTKLAKQLYLSVWPAAGILQGRSVTASVTLAAAATAPVTVNLSTSGGGASVPGSVTIPAGSSTAQFQITGNSAGAVELTAQGADSSYETAKATLLVRGSPAGLKLERLSPQLFGTPLIVPAPDVLLNGGLGLDLGEDLVFRVRDENYLPYPGLRLAVSATGGGAVAPSNPVTDERGQARLRWKLDSNPGVNTLTVTVEGQSDVAARAQAIGVPRPARRRDPRPETEEP